TSRHANLYVELLDLIDKKDPAFANDPPSIYAAICRPRTVDNRPRVETWAYPMELGKPLPELPLPLDEGLIVPLELEASYEDTCRVLRIA
ncbi:MAG TPA: hypothetical protein VGI99_09390, partial [Gemmataceae bacterium]